MWAKLGNLKFEVNTSWAALRVETGTNLVEQALIEGKPILDKVGVDLDKISFSLTLPYQLGIPEQRIKELELARINSEVLLLVFDNGEVWGEYVIKSISRVILNTDASGFITFATADVELLEYVVNDPAGAKAQAARQAAFANQYIKGMPRLQGTQLPTTYQATLQNINAVSGETYYVGSNVKKAKTTLADIEGYKKKITENLHRIQTYALRAQTVVQAVMNIPNSSNLSAALGNVWQGADAINQTLPSAGLTDLNLYNQQLQDLSGSTNAAASAFTGVVGSRRFF